MPFVERKITVGLAAHLNDFNTVNRLCAQAIDVGDMQRGAAGGVAGDDQFIGGRAVIAQLGIEIEMTVVAGIVSRDRQRIVGLVAAAYHRAAVDDIAIDGERIDKVQAALVVNMAVHRGVVAAKGGVRGDINRLRAPRRADGRRFGQP